MTSGQQDVYDALRQFRRPIPDHVLVPVVQHLGRTHQSSSSIRSRRAELVRSGRVEEVGSVKMPSGRSAATFKAVR